MDKIKEWEKVIDDREKAALKAKTSIYKVTKENQKISDENQLLKEDLQSE